MAEDGVPGRPVARVRVRESLVRRQRPDRGGACSPRNHWPRSRHEETVMDSWDIRSLAIEPHHPQVLRSDDETRAIAILLPGGEELQEHQVHERSYLVVADGEIEISQDGDSVTGGSGFLSHFEPSERWTVRALSDARLVLVLAPWPGVGHPSRVMQARAQD
ncbi:MAG: hypothetical protein ACRDKY_07625 [Solirubrobacteraceae bacterium]